MAFGTVIGWGATAVAAAAAVWWEHQRAERAQEQLRETETARAETERERSRLDEQLAARGAELGRRRELIERLHRARRAEREFNEELRGQLQRIRDATGPLGEDEDVRELVLRAAIKLLDAEKGLLLSRTDVDEDGDLDLVAAHGFEDDPEHSAVVQRFAAQVLERDRIVRDDSPAAGDDGDRTPADEEIENLVAVPLYLLDRFHGVVVCANRDGGFAELDDDLLLALGDHAGSALNTQRLQRAVNDAHRATLRVLADALEGRDPLLRREAGETAMLTRILCRRLDLEPAEREVIASAALVHDVGHVALPDRVLQKPGPLSPDERSIMEMHPRVGAQLLREVPALRDVALAVLHHHERFDGGGYPAGLAGDAIPISARVLAIVDAYTAMLHDRPFRCRRTPEEALEELTEEAGGQFDPEIAALFIEEMRRGEYGLHPALADAVAAALDTGGLDTAREAASAHDPLTLLGGHREFREAVQAAIRGAADGDVAMAVALVELDELELINRRQGYAAGDDALLAAARGIQRACLRSSGTAYRESGRRFGVLLSGSGERDLAAELHTELVVGPVFRIGVAEWRPGETADDIVARARVLLDASLAPPPGP